MEVTYFTPGRPVSPGPPLAPYRPAAPAGALTPYLDAYTQPGDLVIDLFCQSAAYVKDAVRASRRALGLNVNQALLLSPFLSLESVDRQAVLAAFTRLTETSKGPQTLQTHIEEMYRTTCAICGADTIADAFVWERDEDIPVIKRYRCAACGDRADSSPRETPTDKADRDAATHFKRRGLSYWLMLDRAASSDAPHRGRIASLLELYTSRNLTALNDLLLKADGLTLPSAERRVLDALLLDTMDHSTSLRPAEPPTSRPRSLQRPVRFVEKNVWRVFERGLRTWRATAPAFFPYSPNLLELIKAAPDGTGQELALGRFHLSTLSSSQAGRDLPPGCAALMVVDPPRPDTVLWHLSALWSYWLWGPKAGAALNPFLNRRRVDRDWFWRGLSNALAAVVPLLRQDGRLVCLLVDDNPDIAEILTLAAARAGYQWIGWGARPPGELRFTLGFSAPSESTPMEADPLSRAVAEQAVETSLDVLRIRGEPVTWSTLHAAIYTSLAESGLLAQVAALVEEIPEPLVWLADVIRSGLDGAPLRQLIRREGDEVKGETGAPLWWLDDPQEEVSATPLSDRVELAVAELLRDSLAVSQEELGRRICARFPGLQTPDAQLIRLCLFSYGEEHAPDHWRLRPEDDLEARAAETDTVLADLRALGQRLGFRISVGIPRKGEWAVCWHDEGGGALYTFAVRSTAILGDLLASPPPPPLPVEPVKSSALPLPGFPRPSTEDASRQRQTVPCLTLPGGRARLVGYKLRHDPRLREKIVRHNWRFLKFRHLRHLVEEVASKQLDRYAFQAALGLDPIVEQEEAQLSLW